MNNYRIDPKHQFSKRLARWTAVFWFFYMTWLSVILILQPQAALYTVYMGIMVTLVMLLNVWAYTKNSVYEKSVFAMLDKAKLDISLKGITNTNINSANETEEDTPDEDTEPEEGDVG